MDIKEIRTELDTMAPVKVVADIVLSHLAEAGITDASEVISILGAAVRIVVMRKYGEKAGDRYIAAIRQFLEMARSEEVLCPMDQGGTS